MHAEPIKTENFVIVMIINKMDCNLPTSSKKHKLLNKQNFHDIDMHNKSYFKPVDWQMLCLFYFRVLYLAVAIFLCLAVCTAIGVILFPRKISVKLVSAFPQNISIPKTNETSPFIIINVSILDTMIVGLIWPCMCK